MTLPYLAYAISERGSINLATVSPTEHDAKANWLSLLGIPPFAYLGAVDRVFEQNAKEKAPALIACVPVEVRIKADIKEDRLDSLERQLREIRERGRHHYGTDAALAAKVEELLERLDGTDRRVAALKQGVNDAMTALGNHTNKIGMMDDRWSRTAERVLKLEEILAKVVADLSAPGDEIGNRTPAHQRIDMVCKTIGSHTATLAEVERRLSQIEDMSVVDRIRKLESQTYEQQKQINKGLQVDRGSQGYRALEGEVRAVDMSYVGTGFMPEVDKVVKEMQVDLAHDPDTESTGAVLGCECYLCARLRANAPKPRGKSLGWLNVYPHGPAAILWGSKAKADSAPEQQARIACVEIFEGEGL